VAPGGGAAPGTRRVRLTGSGQLSVQHSQEGHGCDARASRRYIETPVLSLQLRWQLTQVMCRAFMATPSLTKGTTPAWVGAPPNARQAG